jgi:hypothetical protein
VARLSYFQTSVTGVFLFQFPDYAEKICVRICSMIVGFIIQHTQTMPKKGRGLASLPMRLKDNSLNDICNEGQNARNLKTPIDPKLKNIIIVIIIIIYKPILLPFWK